MNRLIRANFTRLWKSRIFWIGIAYTFVVGLMAVISPYRQSLSYPDFHPHFDDTMFTNSIFMPIVSAVFIGLFVGTEYSNGTIRNKLIVGHTRASVYLSNLVVCETALLIMHIVNIVTVIAIGLPLIGDMKMAAHFLIMTALVSFVTIIALGAIFLLISMLISSKANGSVVAIIFSIVLLLTSMMINARLYEPEYFNAYSVSYTDESGESHTETSERVKNPHYIEGTKREVYLFLNDFLPSGQMVQIANQELAHAGRMPVYSLLITITTTACGILFFRGKNLK